MHKIETVYKIGDLVYTASEYDVDRDVIKAIKIVGLKEEVRYGIKAKDSGIWALWGSGDGYNWYEPGQIFKHKEEADAVHAALKAKKEAKEAQEKAKEKAQRLAKLKREQEVLERGEEYDPYEDD